VGRSDASADAPNNPKTAALANKNVFIDAPKIKVEPPPKLRVRFANNDSIGPIGFAAEQSISDSLTAFGDLFLQPTLRWNNGVHNYMVYGMMNFPIGSYDASRIVNLGLGHWSIDGGGGYTYFDPKTGWEFSAVAGLTYNFINPDPRLSKRDQWPPGLGHLQVRFQASSCRISRLCLSAINGR
jgi:hypothetical protein